MPGLKGDAVVDLNMKEWVKHLAQLICPLMILLTLALQALVLVAMLLFIRYFRPSLGICPASHQSSGDDQLHGGFSGVSFLEIWLTGRPDCYWQGMIEAVQAGLAIASHC